MKHKISAVLRANAVSEAISRLLRRFAPRNDILPKITKVAQECKSQLHGLVGT